MSKGMQIIGFKALAGSVAAKQCWHSIGDIQSRERPAGAQPGKQSVKCCECLRLEIQRATTIEFFYLNKKPQIMVKLSTIGNTGFSAAAGFLIALVTCSALVTACKASGDVCDFFSSLVFN